MSQPITVAPRSLSDPPQSSVAAISAPGQSPSRAGPLAASLTFAWRSLLKIKHVPEQLGDVIGIPILFTLMFTYLFGGAIAGSTGTTCSSSCRHAGASGRFRHRL